MLLNLAFLMMWITVAAAMSTSVVPGKYLGRRKARIERRMSTVTVWLGIVTCLMFICALMYV